MKHFVTLAALLLATAVHAQARDTPCSPTTPNNALCLTITPPTTNVDGSPTILPLQYRVEQKFGTGAFVTVATALSIPRYYAQNLAPGDYTFRVFVNCVGAGCIESTASPTASKTATPNPVQPSPAPIIIIAVTIHADGPPTYRRVIKVTPRTGEAFVMVVPESAWPALANVVQ